MSRQRLLSCTLLLICNNAGGYTTTLRFRRDIDWVFGAQLQGLEAPPTLEENQPCDEACQCKPFYGFEQPRSVAVSNLTVLELGCHEGYTTAFLSAMFTRVIAVDIDTSWLSLARSREKAYSPVAKAVFLRMDLYSDDWGFLRENQIEVVFVDAAHDYPSVKSDIIQSLQLPSVEWLIFHDYGLLDNRTGTLSGHQVKEAVDEFVSLGFIDCGNGEPLTAGMRTKETQGGAIGCMTWGPAGPEAMLCKVRIRWDWNAPAVSTASAFLRSHQASERSWLLYEESSQMSGLRLGDNGRPAAMCVESYGMVRCGGDIRGAGVVEHRDGSDPRARTWKFQHNDVADSVLHLVSNSGSTSFRGFSESASHRRTLVGFSQESLLSFLFKQSSSVRGEMACCTALHSKVPIDLPCRYESAFFFGVYGAPTCKNTSTAMCTDVLECAAAGGRVFNGVFRVMPFLGTLMEFSQSSRRDAILKFKSFLQANSPAVWHFTVCAPCDSLRGLTRYVMMTKLVLRMVETSSPEFGEAAPSPEVMKAVTWEFGNLAYADYLPHYVDTWLVVSH